MLQILHAVHSLNRRTDHRAGGLGPSEILPLLQKLEVLLLHCLIACCMHIMLIVAMRLLYPGFILHSLPQKGQHLAADLRPARKSKVNRLSSFFGDGFGGFCGHVSLLVHFAEAVKGFICSRVGANHALGGTVIMREGIVRFWGGFLVGLLLEGCGHIPSHAV